MQQASGLGAAMLTGSGAAAQSVIEADANAAFSDLSGDEELAIMLADAEPGQLQPGAVGFLKLPGLNENFLKPRELFEQVVGKIISELDTGDFTYQWAEDEVSPDYRHLEEPVYYGFFPVDHDTLTLAAKRNSFELEDDVILFGLRGCRLLPSSPTKAFVRERYPNHQDYRCVLGVWDRVKKEVVAVQASTVPNGRYIYAQQRMKATGTCSNLMPTGLHHYIVGPHRASSNAPQPGAFRQNRSFNTLRSHGRSDSRQAFTIHEYWDLRKNLWVFDNIHAGSFDQRPRDGLYYFSSAGCQTVPGGYTRGSRIPERRWKLFREMAGLTTPSSYRAGWISPDDGKKFKYMLLTARELRLAYRDPGDHPEWHRLRLGSKSESVRAVQTGIGLSGPDGEFGPNTQRAYLQWQLDKFGWADGIVTPKIARDHFGVTI
ncbi:MAG: hypothetical protein MRY63_06190 [Neomegalonema sp.]|nr:hypothetical protein [Neomegalonema sp.]